MRVILPPSRQQDAQARSISQQEGHFRSRASLQRRSHPGMVVDSQPLVQDGSLRLSTKESSRVRFAQTLHEPSYTSHRRSRRDSL